MLAGLLSGRVGLRNCANNINLFLNAYAHSLARNSSNVRDERDPASTLSSLTYEKEDSQPSPVMISQLHIMCSRPSSEDTATSRNPHNR